MKILERKLQERKDLKKNLKMLLLISLNKTRTGELKIFTHKKYLLLVFSDPIDILEQQMINEKNPIKILALDFQLSKMKERKLQQENRSSRIIKKYYKKEKRTIRITKEDFPI